MQPVFNIFKLNFSIRFPLFVLFFCKFSIIFYSLLIFLHKHYLWIFFHSVWVDKKKLWLEKRIVIRTPIMNIPHFQDEEAFSYFGAEDEFSFEWPTKILMDSHMDSKFYSSWSNVAPSAWTWSCNNQILFFIYFATLQRLKTMQTCFKSYMWRNFNIINFLRKVFELCENFFTNLEITWVYEN